MAYSCDITQTYFFNALTSAIPLYLSATTISYATSGMTWVGDNSGWVWESNFSNVVSAACSFDVQFRILNLSAASIGVENGIGLYTGIGSVSPHSQFAVISRDNSSNLNFYFPNIGSPVPNISAVAAPVFPMLIKISFEKNAVARDWNLKVYLNGDLYGHINNVNPNGIFDSGNINPQIAGLRKGGTIRDLQFTGTGLVSACADPEEAPDLFSGYCSIDDYYISLFPKSEWDWTPSTIDESTYNESDVTADNPAVSYSLANFDFPDTIPLFSSVTYMKVNFTAQADGSQGGAMTSLALSAAPNRTIFGPYASFIVAVSVFDLGFASQPTIKIASGLYSNSVTYGTYVMTIGDLYSYDVFHYFSGDDIVTVVYLYDSVGDLIDTITHTDYWGVSYISDAAFYVSLYQPGSYEFASVMTDMIIYGPDLDPETSSICTGEPEAEECPCPDNEVTRFGTNREIDLTQFLPSHLKQSEVNDFLDFTNDFLNTLYSEYQQVLTSAACSACDTKISILEKINRLTELHDPDLVDLEYIQTFANYLGYSVDINKGQIGITTQDDEVSDADARKYLRWVVTNLPNWYKIKTTRNSVKIMLYSFGLIGDIYQKFTKDYASDNGTNWVSFREGEDAINSVGSDFYPTPHFSLMIDLDNSTTDLSFNEGVRNNVLTAINSIRPINTVFDGVTGRISRSLTSYVAPIIRNELFVRMSVP